MKAEALRGLIWLTLASSASILLILSVRRRMRLMLGAEASYSAWMIVPVAMLAVLFPNRADSGSHLSFLRAIDPTAALRHLIDDTAGTSLHVTASIDWTSWVFGAWLLGAALCCMYLGGLQRAFVHGLGAMSGPGRILRADRPGGSPALLGVFRTKVILPPDFRTRYTRLERLLIFRHERIHLRRGDPICNAVAALMRCAFWFNPLVHLASSALREDQEIACDAAVMERRPGARREYARAMLKTQFADKALPVGCHWRAAHHLKERLRMLKVSTPTDRQRAWARALVVATSLVAGCAAWGAAPSAAPAIALQMRWLVNRAEILNSGAAAQGHGLLVQPSHQFDLSARAGGAIYRSSCVLMPRKRDRLLMLCFLSRNGQVFATPSLLTRNGEPGAMEIGDPTQHLDFRMEWTTSIQQ